MNNKMLFSFIFGVIVTCSLAFTPGVQTMVFKPAKPSVVIVRTFSEQLGTIISDDIANYVKLRVKEDFILYTQVVQEQFTLT